MSGGTLGFVDGLSFCISAKCKARACASMAITFFDCAWVITHSLGNSVRQVVQVGERRSTTSALHFGQR